MASIVNPSMIASVLALVLFFTGWQVPELVQDSLSLLGGITAPIAMLVVGVIVARSPMKNVVKEVRLYPYMIIRQLIFPALFYWGFTALGVSPLLAAVFMLMFAMPAGSMCPTFVAQYNGNAQLAAKATIITTVGRSCSFRCWSRSWDWWVSRRHFASLDFPGETCDRRGRFG